MANDDDSVATFAQPLDEVEHHGSLRERGYGVVVISHNMEDVRQVADRISVLRLGRNNGTFATQEVSMQDVIAAITGATSAELEAAVEAAHHVAEGVEL